LARDRSERRTPDAGFASGAQDQKIPFVIAHGLKDALTDVACFNHGVHRNPFRAQLFFYPVQLLAGRLISGDGAGHSHRKCIANGINDMHEHQMGAMTTRHSLRIAKRGRRLLREVCRHNDRFEWELSGVIHLDLLVEHSGGYRSIYFRL
jgi:hypothetical protein